MTLRLFPLVVAALALAGCTGDDGSSEGATTVTRTVTSGAPASSNGGGDGGRASIPDLVDRVAPSVVALLVETPQGSGSGSGVIWSEDGTIVTNDHVVDGATNVEVVFASGERVDAEVLAGDAQTDLAVVQVDREGLPAATFNTTVPRVGSLAIAIGSPLGFQNSVSAGIISGLNRILPAGQNAAPQVDLIQTDAAISPGNSGGALVDGSGEVIGINEAYIPPSTGAVAIGFAIPGSVVTDTVEELINDGEASLAFLGVQPAPLTPELAQQFGLDVETGVVVLDVVEGSAAEQAELQPGDVIVRIADREIASVEDLFAELRNRDAGETVTVTVVRDGEEQQVEVTFAERPQS